MEILLSGYSRNRYGDHIRAIVGDDVSLVTPDSGTTKNPEIAWLSTDLFYDEHARRFYGICASAPGLRWLQSSAAGLDFPLYRPLLERGVRISGSHENSISIAEYVIGAVLRAYQQPELWAQAQERKTWEHREFPEVMGTTWLIVGYGSIGQALAQRASGFGAHILGVRRSKGSDAYAEQLLHPDDLFDHLGDADVVVLSRPGNTDGTALVDREFLALMKPGSLLINVGRGNLIDDDALLEALDRGHVTRAILDVFDPEPLPVTSRYWEHPSVVITPHASAGGRGRYERNADLFCSNLQRFLKGEPLPDEVFLRDLPQVTNTPAQFTSSRDSR